MGRETNEPAVRGEETAEEALIAELRRAGFAAHLHLAEPSVARRAAHRCQRIATFGRSAHAAHFVAAGLSGHGFKFGPLTGRLLAELALDGKTSVPEFEAERKRFAAPTE